MATEFEAIRQRMGLAQPKEVEVTQDELIAAAVRAAEEVQERHQERELEKKSLRELEQEAEDDDEEAMFAAYRQKRLSEMKEKALKEKYGELCQISEPEFIPEVSQARDVWVVLLLFKHGIPACDVATQALRGLATRHRATKFLKIISTQCIRNYPDSNLPTILVEFNGDIKAKFVGIESMGGLGLTPDDLEWRLSQVGAVSTELEEDPQLRRPAIQVRRGFVGRSNASRRSDDEEEDSD